MTENIGKIHKQTKPPVAKTETFNAPQNYQHTSRHTFDAANK